MTHSKIKIFAIITALILTGAAVFWFFMPRDIETFKFLNIETFKPLNPEDQPDSAKFARGDLSEQISTNFNEFQEYTNPKYSFSFSHSKEFSISEFSEGERDVILAKKETSDGFQISITPFDEYGSITKERILKDIPDMRINNDKEILVGGEKALSFTNKDASLETLEIWFIHSGSLYQISAFTGFEEKLEKIIKTWAFK